MPNPYGMTEVDIPGVLGAYQNQQDRRLQQMVATRQIEAADRQQERDDKVAAAWAKFSQGREPQGGAAGAVGAYGAPQGAAAPPQPGSAPQQPQAAAGDPWEDPAAQQELIASLSGAIPAQEVMQLRQAFAQHSDADRKAASENWANLAGAFFELRQIPEAERPAAFQQMIPMLRQLEIPDEMLAQPDLTDRGLEWGVSQARDIEKVIAGRTPTAMPVSGVGVFPVTPGSPYPDFSNGGERPEAQIGEGTVIQNDAGEQMILRNGEWVPMGGGAGNGVGGFPGR